MLADLARSSLPALRLKHNKQKYFNAPPYRHLVGDGNNDGRPTARCRLKLVAWCNGRSQCLAFPEFDKSDIQQQQQNEKEEKKEKK